MADTGFTNPTANEGDGTNPEFTNPNNAHASDNAYATDNPVDNGRNANKWYGFGLDALIPIGAIINGIEVQVEYKMSAALGSDDCDIETLQDSRTPAGNSKAFASQTVEAYYTFGGAADLWNQTWVRGDFTDANFGIYIRSRDSAEAGRTLSIDHIRVKVYYTATSFTGTDTISLTFTKKANLSLIRQTTIALSDTLNIYKGLFISIISTISITDIFTTRNIWNNLVKHISSWVQSNKNNSNWTFPDKHTES